MTFLFKILLIMLLATSVDGAKIKEKTVQLGPHLLSQVKIQLSDKCDKQREWQAYLALLKGHKYNFNVQGLTPNEVRIAFAGDSVTQGCCGTDGKIIDNTPLDTRLTDQTDGSQQALRGFEYYLHELFRNNNATTKYTFLNYAIMAGTISKGVPYQSFLSDCRGEQFNKSMPNFVVLGFGAMDQALRNFTEEKFIREYTEFIKSAQNMPTKPMVMLMVPVFTCQHYQLAKNNTETPQFTPHEECSNEQQLDLQSTIYKIAKATGIPNEHVVNSWRLLRLNPHMRADEVLPADSVHPNLKGMGMIAQEFFMKMSLSPQFLKKQSLAIQGKDQNFNAAVQHTLVQQMIN